MAKWFGADYRRLSVLGGGLGVLVALAACWLYAADVARFDNLSFFTQDPPLGGDFYHFWAAARLVLVGLAEGVYQPDLFTASARDVVALDPHLFYSPLYYPPPYLLWVSLFGGLPFFPALISFFLTSLAVFMAGLWAWVPKRSVLLLFLGFSAVWVNLLTGQNGLLTTGLFALGFYAVPFNPYVAGLFIGLLTIKPHLGVLIPVALIAGGYWRVIKYTVLTFFLLFSLSLSLFGAVTWLYGVPAMLSASTTLGSSLELLLRIPSFYSFSRLSSLDLLVLSWFPQLQMTPHGVSLALQGGLLFLSSVFVIWLWRGGNTSYGLKVAGLAAATLLASPFLYDYDTALMALPVLLLGQHAARDGLKWPEMILLPLGFVWPMLINKFPFWFHVQIGFLAPLMLVLWIAYRVATERVAQRPQFEVNNPA